MTNKINNKTEQNEFYKKKLKTIIITYSIFAIIVFILALLKKYSIISSNFYLIPFYFIMAIIAFIIIVVSCNQMEKEQRKKETAISILINFIGIALLVAFGISIDVRKELIDFSKNATKIDALVYKEVEKDITKHKDNCVGVEKGRYCYTGNNKRLMKDPYYEVKYIYHLRYNVNDEEYTSTYREKENKKFSSELEASKYNQSKYKKGDYITIYYDNDNPENAKSDFSSGFGMIYGIELITIAFQGFYLIKHKKYMKELTK